jgi:hypothetical protein
MAKKTQTPRKTFSGEWLYCNFSAHPEEIAKWKALAAFGQRSLSWWIRDVLNKHVARLEGKSYENQNSNSDGKATEVGVAEVSGDRARSGD